ncbi:hypothetical protein [Aquamicrobium soli]|uniref:Uncharacterized protein n=1 Tax=Aquamicrobium soli TaxID=1811518 RepID=A0ABV7K7T8_9HYPH
MASFNKFNSFVEALAEKVHNLDSDTLTIALCAAANAPVATNTVLADLTQISYTNLSSRTLTVSSSAQASGTYKLVIADKTLTASGGAVAAFRYVVIYNDTAANDELIGWYDYGTALTLADGESLTLDFDNTNGVLTLA